MNRTIFISALAIFCTLDSLFSQICPDCDKFSEAPVYERFWEDPDDIVYQVDLIDQPDKLGLWILFEDLGNNQTRVLHTYHVHCLDNLDGRNRNFSDIENIQVFPNPTSGILTIQHPYDKCTITLYDISGKPVFNSTLIKSKLHSINTSNYIAGVYTLCVTTENTRFNKRVIIN